MPDVTTVRVVHRAWLRVANEMPQQLWDDRGMGGRAKSLWMVNNLQLVWATNGWEQPPGPFYEMREHSFVLQDFLLAHLENGLTSRLPKPPDAVVEGEASHNGELAASTLPLYQQAPAEQFDPPEQFDFELDEERVAE